MNTAPKNVCLVKKMFKKDHHMTFLSLSLSWEASSWPFLIY